MDLSLFITNLKLREFKKSPSFTQQETAKKTVELRVLQLENLGSK